jgi:hypothetical protein
MIFLIMQVCLSTQFGHIGDGHGGRTPTIYYKRPVSKTDMGIAHRTWPIGAKIRITNLRTKKSAVGVVLDRGSYGMRDKKGWFNSRKKKNRARAKALKAKLGEKAYRGCADITYGLAAKIGHNGMERVRITLLSPDQKEPRK